MGSGAKRAFFVWVNSGGGKDMVGMAQRMGVGSGRWRPALNLAHGTRGAREPGRRPLKSSSGFARDQAASPTNQSRHSRRIAGNCFAQKLGCRLKEKDSVKFEGSGVCNHGGKQRPP